MDVMLDLETLGKAAGCPVLSIGATTFDGKHGLTGNHFHEHLFIQPQIDMGATMDPETVMWWLMQPDEARSALIAGQVRAHPPSSVLEHFAGWLTHVECTAIWGNGADFDLPILADAYRRNCKQYRSGPPWKYNAGRDCRTIVALTGKKMGAFGSVNLLAHDAHADAVYQAQEISKMLAHLSNFGA